MNCIQPIGREHRWGCFIESVPFPVVAANRAGWLSHHVGLVLAAFGWHKPDSCFARIRGCMSSIHEAS